MQGWRWQGPPILVGCALRCCYGLLVQVGCARTSHSQMCFRAALSIILWTTLRHLRARSRHSRASRIERKESVCALITEVVASGSVTRADCAKIVGRARYVFCPVFGTAGLASLQPLTNPATKLSLVDGSPGAAAMRTLRSRVSATCPTHFHVNATNQRPVVVLTDACTTKHKLGGLGVVVWDPDDGPARRLYHEAGGVAPWMLALFERLCNRRRHTSRRTSCSLRCVHIPRFRMFFVGGLSITLWTILLRSRGPSKRSRADLTVRVLSML